MGGVKLESNRGWVEIIDFFGWDVGCLRPMNQRYDCCFLGQLSIGGPLNPNMGCVAIQVFSYAGLHVACVMNLPGGEGGCTAAFAVLVSSLNLPVPVFQVTSELWDLDSNPLFCAMCF